MDQKESKYFLSLSRMSAFHVIIITVKFNNDLNKTFETRLANRNVKFLLLLFIYLFIYLCIYLFIYSLLLLYGSRCHSHLLVDETW